MKTISTNGAAGSTPTRGYLGHQRPDRERAFLAARHYAEGRPIDWPTRAQIAHAYRVELAAMVREHKAAMAAMRREHNGHNGTKPTLAEHLASASLSERIEAAKQLGVDTVWDSMIAPLVGNGKDAA